MKVSFLQNAPRFFSADMNVFKEMNCWDLYKETYNLVFTTFLRLATLEESEVQLFFLFIQASTYITIITGLVHLS